MVTALLVVALQAAACLGLGAAALRVLGVLSALRGGERPWFAFALGFGILGWLVFPLGAAGLLNRGALLALLALGAAGVVFLGRPRLAGFAESLGWPGHALIMLLAVALSFDLLEGLAPPTEADSLAYHFALPKQFLAAGRIEFVPRAVEGAIPLLVQMTYVPVLGLGGEAALTLWTMASGWAAAGLLYALARRFLTVVWSLALALVFATTPAMVYAAGSGQVEPRLALFALVAVFAVAEALATGLRRHALLAGLAAGFFMGGKYTGLLFAAACVLVLLAQRRRLAHSAAFAAAALAAGGPWYGWNWYHAGDPLFPALFPLLGAAEGLWDAAHHVNFQTAFLDVERPLPRAPWWLVLYPFLATLAGPEGIESGRTGFGPFGLVMLPFVAAGLWRFRDRLAASRLAAAAVVLLLFYGLWFFVGGSQRIRHLLPVYPVFLLCAGVAAARFAEAAAQAGAAAGALATVLLVQAAGHGVFSATYARHLFSGESREDFLVRSVKVYGVVPWINANLAEPGIRIATDERQLVYGLQVPVYLVHPVFDARIELLPTSRDPLRYLRQLKAQGITHVLYLDWPEGQVRRSLPFARLTRALIDRGCTEHVRRLTAARFASRTLPNLVRFEHPADIHRLGDESCLK